MDKGIALIKEFEGLRLKAYKCPAGVWTIGYGVTRLNGKPVKSTDKLANEAEADRLLREQVKDDFLPQLQKIPTWRQLNRNQQGALLSFAWNLGANFYELKLPDGSEPFKTISRALKSDLAGVPEAMNLYNKSDGKKSDGLVRRRKAEGELWLEPVSEPTEQKPSQINLIEYPSLVSVNESFNIIGKYYGEPDAVLNVTADGRFKLPDCQVKDGVIDYELKLNTPGDRLITFSYGNDSRQITIGTVVMVSPDKDVKPEPVKPSKLVLSGSVGNGGKNNPDDLKAVQSRLQSLGYRITVDGKVGNQTIQQIRLFQSIINGQTVVSGDGRIDVNGKTHQWLNAENAPRWQIMPNTNQAISYRNQELEETHDHHDYGTDWMAGAILWIAKNYHETYRSKTPKSAPFSINDISLPTGGNTPDHTGHETGMSCDVFLPRKDGGTGGIDYTMASYDRAATEAILRSINACPTVKKSSIYFNDPHLVAKGLCRSVRGHHHHVHFEVKTPTINPI